MALQAIGHEISHAFDDKGSQFDGDGNLRNWWTKEDRDNFDKRTALLANQYSQYEVLPGRTLNGELTLGEILPIWEEQKLLSGHIKFL